MINVTFHMNEKLKTVTLRVKGHSGMVTKGNDIICASASILAYTLAQNIKTAGEQDKLMMSPTIRLNSGNAKVKCYVKPEYYDEIVHAYLVIQTGFRLLNANYPDFVSLITFGKA